jgi:hypothetical protein
MPIASREQLKEYCLRQLGHPVLEINVDDQQVEDRIQDAIDYYQEYHFDGVERVYLKAQVVPSIIILTTPHNDSFIPGETVLGQTSGATAKLYRLNDGNSQLTLENGLQGTFVVGETVIGNQSNTTGIVQSFTIGNWDLEYFEVSDAVLGVINVFPIGPTGFGSPSRNLFDLAYQFRMTDLYDLLSTDMIYYSQVKRHMQMLEMLLPGRRSMRFNRKSNRIYVDANWREIFHPGEYVIVECYRILDPEEFTKIYNDMFIKKYATALIKMQWGTNMKKFEGVQLPGGVTLNGQQIYNEAREEVDNIRQEMLTTYSLPIDFCIG